MKNIIFSAVFLFGVSGAAFADQNNKPADYINKLGGTSVTTNAFSAAGATRKLIRCDADPRYNRAECSHDNSSKSKSPESPSQDTSVED